MAAWVGVSFGVAEGFGVVDTSSVEVGKSGGNVAGWVIAISGVVSTSPIVVETGLACGEGALHPTRIKLISTHIKPLFIKAGSVTYGHSNAQD